MIRRTLRLALLAGLLASCSGPTPVRPPTSTLDSGPTSTPRSLPTDAGPTTLPEPTTSPVEGTVYLTGQHASAALAVAVEANFAYLGFGARLLVLDVSDPAQPMLLGQSGSLPDMVRDIVVSEGVAYLAAGWGGLIVMDVGDPAHPAVVGQFQGPDEIRRVALDETMAYLAAGDAGVLAVDVVDPRAPRLLGSFDPPGSTESVAVAGFTAYVAAGEGGLWFVDVSDPARPAGTALGELIDLAAPDPDYTYSLSEGLQVHDVALSGNLLLFAVGDPSFDPFSKGVRILDVADPTHPRPIGSYLSYELAARVGTAESLVLYTEVTSYPSEGFSLHAVDASNPADPILVGSFYSDHEFFDLAVDGPYLFLANGAKGLRVFELAADGDPRLIGSYEPPALMAGTVADSEPPYIYLAAGETGLMIVDGSDLSNPFGISVFDTPGYALDVEVADHLAFVADTEGGLRLLDVSDPARPRELPVPETNHYIVGVELSGEYLFTWSDIGDLFVRSLAELEGPLLEPVFLEVGIGELRFSGEFAYAVSEYGTFLSLDFSQPLQPRTLGGLEPDAYLFDLAVVGPLVYLVSEEFPISKEADVYPGGLRVVDVTDPSEPKEVGYSQLPALASSVAATGSWVAVGLVDGRVYLFDVSNPESPVEMAQYLTPVGWVTDLVFSDSVLLVMGESGASVLRIGEVPPLGDLAGMPVLIIPTPVQLASAPTFLEPPAAPPEGTPTGEPIGLTRLAMLSRDVGWALGGLSGAAYSNVLRTTDAGHTWRDVTPPEPDLVEVAEAGDFSSADPWFADELRAWVIYQNSSVVWRTTDGGVTWQPSLPLPLAGTEPDDEFFDQYLSPLALQFIDPLNGWLAVNEAWGMMHGDLEILRTRDGGASWEHIHHGSIYSFRGMAFLDVRTGWLADGERDFSAEALERSKDGGRTWSAVTQLGGAAAEGMYARCEALCPVQFLQVFPPGGVLLVVTRNTFDTDFEPVSALYRSTDGGTTWQERPLPLETTAAASVEFVDLQLGWLLDEHTGRLLATEDGGLTWNLARQIGWSGRLNFISEQLGWAIAWPSDEGEPPYWDLGGRVLLRTTDAGRTWGQLQPVLVP